MLAIDRVSEAAAEQLSRHKRCAVRQQQQTQKRRMNRAGNLHSLPSERRLGSLPTTASKDIVVCARAQRARWRQHPAGYVGADQRPLEIAQQHMVATRVISQY